MVMEQPMAKSEQQFQAEMDAHALIGAEQVKSVPARLKRAKVAARKIAAEATKAATQAKRVASKPKKTGRRRGR